MTTEQLRVLKVLDKGGKIEARRTFPHPYKFWLLKADGHRYASELADLTVSELLVGKYIVPVPNKDWRKDSIDYDITKAGRKALSKKPIKAECEQIIMPGTEAA